jgi:HEAT repeat protein
MLAISALEQIGGTDAFAMLTTLVDDSQPEVQLAAIRALGPLAEPADVQFAREHMTYTHPQGDDRATERVRGLAALAVGKIGNKHDSTLLYQAMAEDRIYIRLTAARATLDYLKRYGNLSR